MLSFSPSLIQNNFFGANLQEEAEQLNKKERDFNDKPKYSKQN